MKSIILSCVGVILLSSSLYLPALSSLHDQELDLDVDQTLRDRGGIEEVDPLDMGSYSYTTKSNNRGQKKQDGEDVEETVVKRAIYRRGDGSSGQSPSLLLTETPSMTSVKKSSGHGVESGVVEVVGDGREYVQYTETTTKYKRGECVCPTMDQTPVMIYMRQMIGSLLDQMGVRYHNFGPGETITIDLQGEISYESFMELSIFLSSTDGEGHKYLQPVSEIISNLLHTVHTHQPMGSIGFITDRILLHLPNLTTPKFWLTLFSLTVIGFTTLVLCCLMLRASDSPSRLLLYGALLFFVFSCVWIYAEKHENSKAENAARLEQFESIPRDCQYNNFTQWERVKYFLRVNMAGYDDECAQYYRASSIDPFYRNTPVEAISEAAARFVFHPLEYIGDKMGGFLNSITKGVPFWMRPFLLILLFMIIFFGLFPYRIRTPLLSIEPVSRPQLQPPPTLPHQDGIAGPIVPLHRLDAATDTDDLEEFILRQEQGRERENYEQGETQRPRLLPTSSSSSRWSVLSKSGLYYCRTLYTLVLRLLTIVLRDTPHFNFQDQHHPEEDEIWEEHHQNQNQMEIMPEQEPVRRPPPMPVPNFLNGPRVPYPDDGGFGVGGAVGLVGGDSGLEEGFLLDFDEATLGDHDELLEGEILVSPPTERGGVGGRQGLRSTLLGFDAISGGLRTNQNTSHSTHQPPSSSRSHPHFPRHFHHRKNS